MEQAPPEQHLPDAPYPPEDRSPGFFARLIRSCYDRDFYRNAVEETGGQAVWYLFRFLILAGLVLGLVLATHAWTIADEVTASLQNELPTVTFENGDITIDAETPAWYSIGKHGQIVIDPAGEETRGDLPSEVRAVFVDGRVYLRGPTNEFESYSTRLYDPGTVDEEEDPAEDLTTLTFDGQQLRDWLVPIQGILLGVAILIALLNVFFFNLIRLFLFSLGGYLALFELTTSLSAGDVLKICCYAVTPVALVSVALTALHVDLPWREFILLAAGTVWVYLITKHLGEFPRYQQRDDLPRVG